MNGRLRLAIPVLGVAICLVVFYFLKSGVSGGTPAATGHKSTATGTADNASTAVAASSAETATDSGISASSDTATSTSSNALGVILPKLVMKPFADSDKQAVLRMPPQQQAEQLMMAAVNHYEGATDLMKERLSSWRGQLKKTPAWDTAELEARYSSDMRVRDVAIDVDLTILQLDKSAETVERLISDAQANAGNRGYDLTILGMLANRDMERDRIHMALRNWAHDPDEGTRYWAIEGLAYIGTDDTVSDFLEVLRTDASLNVRQRCGASLAKSGMLTRVQRMSAVPGLLEIAANTSQDSTTRGWAFQALHEITAQPIGSDVEAWKNWYASHGSERVEDFRHADPNAVLGNS
jgi:hypothetical protein